MLPMERERSVQKSICQMACLIVAQFVYLMGGSAMFMFLERGNAQRKYQETLAALIEVRETLNLTTKQEEVLQEAFGYGFSFHDTVLPPKASHAWDFISTLYFSITSTTTIGYGHHSPRTAAGQLFCIAFSLGGIPLHMVTLGTIGRHLNTVINRFLLWSMGGFVKAGAAKKDIATFLFTCSLLVLFTIFSAGSVRLVIPDISYVEAIYFIYVTISTIGFGDFVIRFEQESHVNRVLILMLWALALYVGMSILSATVMSISTRAKQNYKFIFNLTSRFWNKKVRGEKYRRAKKKATSPGVEEAGLIMVDKEFLIEQLDLQTDPDKRAEIQMWIDKYDACVSSDDSYNCSESGSEYTSTPDNGQD